MSILNIYYQGYHIKFNNNNVHNTIININDVETKIKTELSFNSNIIQLHIDEIFDQNLKKVF